jgi:thiol-disulfide isomerase/thioredoxin
MAISVKHLVLAALIGLTTLTVARQDADFPAYVKEKTLYAKNDFRGKKAPEFYVQQWLNRTGVDTKGKVVLIDFWATWCGPCRALIPELNEFNKKFADKLVVIGVSDEPAETVQKFMKDTPMDYAVAIDTSKKMSSAIGVQGIPHCIIMSPDGIVRWQGFPGSDEDKLTEQVIQQIISASKVK